MNFLIPGLADIIDILLIAGLIYRIFVMSKRAGSIQIIIIIVAFIIMFSIANLLELKMMSSLLRTIRDNWLLAFIIIFQPEIRNFLNKMAHMHSWQSLFKNPQKSIYSPLLNAISIMSFRKIGALIVIERNNKLNDLIESGEIIDAQISVKLLLTVFNNKAILHDGAIIIRDARIYAVKVVLPLSEKVEYAQKFGTRHLAAIGVTEQSDAVSIVVSEETGRISVARSGEILSDISIDELSQFIKDATQ
jgi:diadenylate cyclase